MCLLSKKRVFARFVIQELQKCKEFYKEVHYEYYREVHSENSLQKVYRKI